MARWTHNDVLDAPIDYLIANADRMILCAGQPVDFNDASVTRNLGEAAIDAGDWTKADGDASGRKGTLAAQSGTVDVGGTYDHVALVDDATSKLLYVWVAGASQALVAGNPWNTGAVDVEFGDPVAP